MLSKSNYEFLAKFRSKPAYDSVKSDTRFKYFCELQYIEPESYVRSGELDDISITPIAFRLTPRGEDALAEFEQTIDNLAKNNAEKKASRIFQIFLVIFGAIVTLFIEHIADIIAWVISLF